MTLERSHDLIVSSVQAAFDVPIVKRRFFAATASRVLHISTFIRRGTRRVREFLSRQVVALVVVRPQVSIDYHILRMEVVEKRVAKMLAPERACATFFAVQDGWLCVISLIGKRLPPSAVCCR